MRVSQKSVGLALSTATPREWERIRDLFEKVLGRTPGERDALLDEHCAGEPRLRDKIENLLGEYGKVEAQVESTITCSMPAGQPVGSGRVTFAAGESLCNRFCIIRLLGTGGMGEVYEAQDLVLGERVALKTIRCETAADQRAFARFVGEVHAAQKIAHPNVCRPDPRYSQASTSLKLTHRQYTFSQWSCSGERRYLRTCAAAAL